jgi:hypothetical protein
MPERFKRSVLVSVIVFYDYLFCGVYPFLVGRFNPALGCPFALFFSPVNVLLRPCVCPANGQGVGLRYIVLHGKARLQKAKACFVGETLFWKI